jgi:hypothetical protein
MKVTKQEIVDFRLNIINLLVNTNLIKHANKNKTINCSCGKKHEAIEEVCKEVMDVVTKMTDDQVKKFIKGIKKGKFVIVQLVLWLYETAFKKQLAEEIEKRGLTQQAAEVFTKMNQSKNQE